MHCIRTARAISGFVDSHLGRVGFDPPHLHGEAWLDPRGRALSLLASSGLPLKTGKQLLRMTTWSRTGANATTRNRFSQQPPDRAAISLSAPQRVMSGGALRTAGWDLPPMFAASERSEGGSPSPA